MKKVFQSISSTLLVGSLIYVATHLPSLTLLPVFADEAIYIRWAQLILDDWRQYLFFSLNDGKTPLFIWLTAGALQIFSNPLVAGRLVAVMVGLIQVWVTTLTVKKLGGKNISTWFASLSIIWLPFWYFHHRMALMDGLLVLMLSLALYQLIITSAKPAQQFKSVFLAGLFFGLALLSKLPALLFMPALLLTPLMIKQKKANLAKIATQGITAVLIGLLVFLTLKLHPAFGQLFNRGNDFLYPVGEVLAAGVWPIVLTNLANVWQVLNAYLTWPVLILPFLGLWQAKWRAKHLLLILATLGFLAPVVLLSKIIYPRYLLPAAIPVTISAALAFEQYFLITRRLTRKPVTFLIRASLLVFGLTFITTAALNFTLISWQSPNHLPFTGLDQEQYLREWSAGNGIKEVTDSLLFEAQEKTIAVATEGYFGTLPDGMLMYLHNQDVTYILVEGIGQPIHRIPDEFIAKTQNYDQVWLVVNSHRQLMKLEQNPNAVLLQNHCRVGRAPCLQVWDITSLVQAQEQSP